MALIPGTRLVPYEILSAIGAGGMGEVYRARDTRLDRIVAIKVLPVHLADRPELRERFEREARTIASLNHPHICTLYDVGHQNGTDFLVMEYLEGETLAQRLLKGPLPLNQVLQYAIEIANSLDKAHRKGVTHRDLKPGNVMLTKSGTKLLDFGLAKLQQEVAPAKIQVSQSPTMSQPLTAQGTIVGTLQYMAPEQLEGAEVDARTDIFALGTVVYEMATGNRAFEGKSQASVIAKILESEPPPISSLQPMTPPALDRVIKRCLAKEPDERWQSANDLANELKWIAEGGSQVGLAPTAAAKGNRARWRGALPWAIAALLFVTLAPPIVFMHVREKLSHPADLMRFEIPVPQKATLVVTGAFALSPDGRKLAFAVAGSEGVARLWIRSLDSPEARPLPGSESPSIPPFFWSPDSRHIAFDAGGKLKKIDISGGAAETLCDLSGLAIGGSWNRDGVIIFGQQNGGLMRVSANGGSALPLTVLDPSRKETLHAFPSFLPDGRNFVYFRKSNKPENSGVYVGSLNAKPEEQDPKLRLTTDHAATYVPSSDPGSGQLLFMRDGTLMAQPFDASQRELVGEPVPVAEQLGFYLAFGFFSASADGVLVYRAGGAGISQLTWFDRDGKVLGTGGESGSYSYSSLDLAPDGTQAAVSRRDSPSANGTLWLVDFSRGTTARFTFGPSFALEGTWSPDGRRIIFASKAGGVYDLYQKLASGVNDEEPLLKSSKDKYPTSWSRDGHFLLYEEASDQKSTKYGLSVLSLEGDQKTFPFVHTEFNNTDGRFSPDGHWVVYESNESGQNEIYVRTFSSDLTAAASVTAGKWLISTGGGHGPRWRGDGKELYYLAPDGKLMAVAITTNPVFRAGVPKALFQTQQATGSSLTYSWDLTPDGKRFLFPAPAGQTGQAPFTVVLNWQAGLKK